MSWKINWWIKVWFYESHSGFGLKTVQRLILLHDMTCSPQHTHSYEPFSLLTLLSSGSLKLWLLKDEELRLISSGCMRLPTPSWFPCLSSSSSTSGSLSFFRFALLMESSSEKRLTRGRSDGDLFVVKSGLWISVDKGEGRSGLKPRKQSDTTDSCVIKVVSAWWGNS